MDEMAEHDKLVGLIYDAALEPARWSDALTVLGKSLGVDACHLVGWQTRTQTDVLGVICDPYWHKALCEYQAYFGKLDPRRELASKLGTGRIFACHHYFDETFVNRSEFYQDFLRPHGLRYTLASCLYQDDTLEISLGLIRAAECGPYSDTDQERFTRLKPHIHRAVQLMLRGETLSRKADIAEAALDISPLAVIAVDRHRRPVYANKRAEALLDAGHLLTTRGGVLCAVESRQGEQLDVALETTLKTRRPRNILLKTCVTNGEEESFSLTMLHVSEHRLSAVHQSTVLCLIAPLSVRRIATGHQLMEMFDLTAAEARLARALAQGMRLEDYAVCNDLRLPTVKTQLRGIFAKTATSRQAELVRLITEIPAVRER